MPNGLGAGAGLAAGFASGFNTVDNYYYHQGLLDLENKRQQQGEQNKRRAEFMQLRSDAVSHLAETAQQLKIAHPDWGPMQLASNPAIVSLKNMIGGFDKNLGLPDTIDSIVASLAERPSAAVTEAAMARAKEGPLAQEEKRARIDYLKSGTPKPFNGASNPDAPGLPGNDTALGTPASFNQRFAQSGTTQTDVGADVGEQAGQDYLKKAVPPQDRDLVSSIANYDTDPQKAASGRVPRGQERSVRQTLIEQAMAYAKAKGETYNPRAFTAVQDFIGNGRHGDQVRSLNVITEHMGTLRQLGEALDNGDVRAFNAAAQRWATEFGKSAPTSFQAAKDIVGTELIKALGVAGAGSAEERAQLDRRLSVASSPQQIQDAINDVYGPLLTGQLKGLRSQYLSAGGPREKFDKALLPGTREFIDKEPNKKKKSSGSGEWQVEEIK